MLSREQGQALTHLVHLLRPAWNIEGIYAAVMRCSDRDAIEVALATLRATGDRKAQNPGVIPTSGPHWNELPATTPPRPRMSRDEMRARTCATCGFIECSGRDHPFVPLTQAASGRSLAVDDARAALASSRAGLCACGVLKRTCAEHKTERADEETNA